jgi:hypothetical protein
VKRRPALGLTLLVAASGGVALAATAGHAARATGGLSLSPVIVQQPAAAGPLAPFTVVNRSDAKLDVTVAARPWTQASSGKVQPDRRHSLAGVSVAQPSFTLAPGQSQSVGVTVGTVPAGGALYGALDVVGLPTDAEKAKGVVLGYRLVGTLRLTPAVAVHELRASVKVRRRTLALDVTNRGNTVDPVSADVTLKEPRGTRSPAVRPVRILPGRTVRLLSTRLRSRSYRMTARLEQAGKRVVTVTAGGGHG